MTLELGGKSPAFVADDADLEVAARRIVWGKFTNAGQTCVAPDYVSRAATTLEALKPLLVQGDPRGVRRRPVAVARLRPHRQRRATSSGSPRSSTRPGRHRWSVRRGPRATSRRPCVEVVDPDDPRELVMREEIFGPVLPLVEVDDLDAAIDFVNRPRQAARALRLHHVGRGAAAVRARHLVGGARLQHPARPPRRARTCPSAASGPAAWAPTTASDRSSSSRTPRPCCRCPRGPTRRVWVRPPFTAAQAAGHRPHRRPRAPTPATSHPSRRMTMRCR